MTMIDKQYDMGKAIEAVRVGMSQITAAIRFKVPSISLLRRVRGNILNLLHIRLFLLRLKISPSQELLL